MSHEKSKWLLLTALHMTIDGLCICSLYTLAPDMDRQKMVLMVLVYNCLAFLTQPLMGLWMDMKQARRLFLFGSIGTLLTGGLLTILLTILTHSSHLNISNWSTLSNTTLILFPFVITILIGIGNSLFHIFGSKHITEYFGNDIHHLGVFVSTGALGLAIGGHWSSTYMLIGIMVTITILTLLFIKVEKLSSQDSIHKKNNHILSPCTREMPLSNKLWLFAFALLIVFIRSMFGKIIPSAQYYGMLYIFLTTLFAFLGKASGGYIANIFGESRTLLLSLLLSGICFLLGFYNYAFLIMMVLFINISMPITLHLANKCFPHHIGFAFGMLAACLIPGYELGDFLSGWNLTDYLLYPLVATIIIEILTLLALKEQRFSVLAMSLVMNILTNVPLNLFSWYGSNYLSFPLILALEAIVMAVETVLFYLVVQNWRTAIKYSIFCNLTSYFVGIVCQFLNT